MSEKILIVDDESDLLKLLDFSMRGAGFETVLARNGKDALALARQQKPDLILLDLMLPDIQGIDVCRTLKVDPVTRSIPIIMVTAKSANIHCSTCE